MMEKCYLCSTEFDTHDGGARCFHCGVIFCPEHEHFRLSAVCLACCVPQILERVFSPYAWQKYLHGISNDVDHVNWMLAQPAGTLGEAEEGLLRKIHSLRYGGKTETATEDRDEPMPAPEAPVKIVVAEVTCPEVRHTIAMVLKEQAPAFGITKASFIRNDSTIELWGLWPVNSNSGTRASIKVYLDGLMNGVIGTYRRQREVAADGATENFTERNVG